MCLYSPHDNPPPPKLLSPTSMDNCLFVANLPQNLTNYELTIALYLVFSKFGKVLVVKASRDSFNRPYGFVEFPSSSAGRGSCKAAMAENSLNGGIVIGGRTIRLEVAKSTAKLTICASCDDQNIQNAMKVYEKAFKFTASSYKRDDQTQSLLIKLDNPATLTAFVSVIKDSHPTWEIREMSKETIETQLLIAESIQRQSGLFQLRIPESGVLPVSPATLAKIQGLSPSLQYSVTPCLATSSLFPPQTTPLGLVSRRYEDLTFATDGSKIEETYTDPIKAKDALLELNPPMGSSGADVFFARLNNQEVTLQVLLNRTAKYGPVQFMRLCNRLVTRIDNIPVDSTAYVRFANAQDAESCIAGENGATWLGRIIKCERCWSLTERQTPPLSH